MTLPTIFATPKTRESSVAYSLSPTIHQPYGSGRTARFTTSRSGRLRKVATTTSPGRTGRPPRLTSSMSPCLRVGAIDGPCTSTGNSWSSVGTGSLCRQLLEDPREVVPANHHRQRSLRPAVWRLRPGSGPYRGGVGQGHLREVPGQHRLGLSHARPDYQGAAL